MLLTGGKIRVAAATDTAPCPDGCVIKSVPAAGLAKMNLTTCGAIISRLSQPVNAAVVPAPGKTVDGTQVLATTSPNFENQPALVHLVPQTTNKGRQVQPNKLPVSFKLLPGALLHTASSGFMNK